MPATDRATLAADCLAIFNEELERGLVGAAFRAANRIADALLAGPLATPPGPGEDVYERLELLRRRVYDALGGEYESGAHGGPIRPTDDEVVGFAVMRARQVAMLHRHHHTGAATDGECPTCGMYARAAAPGSEGEAVERVRAWLADPASSATPDAAEVAALVLAYDGLLAAIDRLTAEQAASLSAGLVETSASLAALAAGGPDLRSNAHLKCRDEAAEFADDPCLQEAADVLITVRAAADHRGWSDADLAAAVRAKNAINAARTWEQQEDGTWQHVPGERA